MQVSKVFILSTLIHCVVFGHAFAKTPTVSAQSTKLPLVLGAAQNALDNFNISYAYGGSQLGSPEQCKSCNLCLDQNQAQPKQQLQVCPECKDCSMDCSHFVAWVFRSAGLSLPYLTTKTMLDASPAILAQRYQLIDLATRLDMAAAGDLLVYRGHVILLESLGKNGLGTVIHATGGKDLKGPGMGIQRERKVPLAKFRGPLLRILRHRQLSAAPLR